MRNPLAGKLEEAQAALALAEAKIEEQRDIMTDLLLLLGSRTACVKCSAPVLWIPLRGGEVITYNLNGTQHWPRCPGAERPRVAVAGE